MARRAKKRSKDRRPRLRRVVKLPAEYFDAIEHGNLIFPLLYQFENGLRLAINKFLGDCYGASWWDVSLRARLGTVFAYAENQQKKLSSMPWIGASSAVPVLPIHLVTLGHLEEVIKNYKSDCIPDLFPTLEFFLGHMEVIKRVRNMYTHMFPCITASDSRIARSEITTLSLHINSILV